MSNYKAPEGALKPGGLTGGQQGSLPGRGSSEPACGVASKREAHVWDQADRAAGPAMEAQKALGPRRGRGGGWRALRREQSRLLQEGTEIGVGLGLGSRGKWFAEQLNNSRDQRGGLRCWVKKRQVGRKRA